MNRTIIFLIAIICLLFSLTAADVFGASGDEEEADKAAIEKASLDYIEGWYEGNAERMERALHPDLAKRGVFFNSESGKTTLKKAGADDMVAYTREGRGKNLDKRDKVKLDILDVFKNTACVKIVSPDYVDYIHLARYEGAWAIVNVIWEMNK